VGVESSRSGSHKCPGVMPRITIGDRNPVCGKPAIVALWYVRTRGTNAGLVGSGTLMVTDKRA